MEWNRIFGGNTLFSVIICFLLSTQARGYYMHKKIYGCSETEEEARKNVRNLHRTNVIGTVEDIWLGYYNYTITLTNKQDHNVELRVKSNRAVITPFMIHPGEYFCTFSMTSSKYRQTYVYDTWHMVALANLTEMVSGGHFRTFPAGKELKLTAMDYYTNKLKYYKVYWTCQQKLHSGSFCGKLWRTNTFEVPAKHIVEGEEFRFTMNIKIGDGIDENFVQVVAIRAANKTAGLRAVCVQNCAPYANVSSTTQPTIFRAECDENCKIVADKNYKWTILTNDGKPLDVDYRAITKNGNLNKEFNIKANSLKAGNYTIVLSLDYLPIDGESRIEGVIFETPPTLAKECFMWPPDGMPDLSSFGFFCEQIHVTIP